MARHAKKGGHGEHGADEAWLLPYSDLMTLLLAVFIVLFAVSNIDKDKAEQISKAFEGIFNTGQGTTGGNIYVTPSPPIELETPAIGPGGDPEMDRLKEVRKEIEIFLQEQGLGNAVFTSIDERGLVVTLDSSTFFDSASVVIKPEVRAILVEIGKKISTLDNYVRVEGHTDNLPISTSQFPSNWELSSARASRVIRLFSDESGVVRERMLAVGYAETRPVADNDTEEGRGRNRRVDIILLDKKYNMLEDLTKEAVS